MVMLATRAVGAAILTAVALMGGYLVTGRGITHSIVQNTTLSLSPDPLVVIGGADVGVKGVAAVMENIGTTTGRMSWRHIFQAAPVPIVNQEVALFRGEVTPKERKVGGAKYLVGNKTYYVPHVFACRPVVKVDCKGIRGDRDGHDPTYSAVSICARGIFRSIAPKGARIGGWS